MFPVLLLAAAASAACLSPIEHVAPPPCTAIEGVAALGPERTAEYATVLLGAPNYHLTNVQRQCILESRRWPVSRNIATCLDMLTLHDNTTQWPPYRVAQGLARDPATGKFVSACAAPLGVPMPCVAFNLFVQNGSFSALMDRCHATDEVHKWLLNNSVFLEASFSGVRRCQHEYPAMCLYREREPCTARDRVYPCAVSRWVYAANFMLFYVLSPAAAARMPACRIIGT